ncbi:MAG: mucoidy inhibitor MuiA family protein [bacterium]|nr:mucoidy inhibitor MuiA family protein [bacterium]
MKIRILRSLAILFSVFPINVFSDQVAFDSKISKVTLFQDRALITRIAQGQVAAGMHNIVLSSFPDSIDATSLSIKGIGTSKVEIQGLEFKTRFLETPVLDRAKTLESEIEKLKSQIDELINAKKRMEGEKKLLLSLKLDAPVPSESDKSLRPRTASEMRDVLKFISESVTKIDSDMGIVNTSKVTLQKKLSTLQQELEQIQPTPKSESIVDISVDSKEAGNFKLELSYQVIGANWQPVYNLNIQRASLERKYELETYGVIKQQTGEDWNNVELVLSTARPGVGIDRPIPVALIFDVMPPPMILQKMELAGSPQRGANNESIAPLSAMPATADDLTLQQEATEQSAELSKYGSLTYKIPSLVTIKSDGSTEKIKVTESSLQGSESNVAVPFQSSEVYEEGKLTVASAPLLPGMVSIFADGGFLGSTYLPFTAAGKEFQMPLGVSNELSVKRTLLNKFEDDSGVVRSFRRIKAIYEIEVENFTDAAKKIIVLDRGIVSRNEKITATVTMEDPKSIAKEDPTRLNKEEGIMEWHLDLAAKDKKTIRYELTVEFPTDLSVQGVEEL